MQFKKSLMLPIILSVLGIFLSVSIFIYLQVISRIEAGVAGASPLAIFELVVFVLMLSALSAKKPVFTKVVCIISIAAMILATFVVSIVTSVTFQLRNVTWDSISFLALAILSLVATILFFIYYLIGKEGMLKKLSVITNVVSISLLLVFGIVLVLSSSFGAYSTQNTPLYGVGLALLLGNSGLIFGIIYSLQNNLTPKEE